MGRKGARVRGCEGARVRGARVRGATVRSATVRGALLLLAVAVSAVDVDAQARRGRGPAPPALKTEPAVVECPSLLGEGVTTKRSFCDVLTGRDPAAGILI